MKIHSVGARTVKPTTKLIQWKQLITITLVPALFDNRLITLSRGYKKLNYLTQFIVTTFYMYKKTYVVLPVVCLHLVVPE
jgi:hypothetical protein